MAAKGETLDLNLLIKIDDALDNLLLPYSFDLSILAGIDNPALVEHIQRVGQLFIRDDSPGLSGNASRLNW